MVPFSIYEMAVIVALAIIGVRFVGPMIPGGSSA
jgi:hypothetical protein